MHVRRDTGFFLNHISHRIFHQQVITQSGSTAVVEAEALDRVLTIASRALEYMRSERDS